MLYETKIGELIERLERLDEVQLWIKAVDNHSFLTFVVEINRMQLQQGKDSEGERLTNQQTGDDSYSPVTVEIYRNVGRSIQAGGHYTMKFSGEFYDSIEINRVMADYFEIEADPIKGSDNLYEKFGRNILGIDEENLEKIIWKLTESYIHELRRYLLGEN